MAKEKRFENIYTQDLGTVSVLVDKVTGVNYLVVANAGLTPVLDRDGKPVISRLPLETK